MQRSMRAIALLFILINLGSCSSSGERLQESELHNKEYRGNGQRQLETNKEPQSQTIASVISDRTSTQTDDVEEDGSLAKRTAVLFDQLLQFKDDTEFHRSGFAPGSPYNQWLQSVHKLVNDPNSKMLLQKGFTAGDLLQLGQEYRSSQGRETEYSKYMRPVIESGLSGINQ